MSQSNKEANIQRARDIYNTPHWGESYFDINAQGEVVTFPDGDKKKAGISLPTLIKDIQATGLKLPLLIRFTDILRNRLNNLRNAFHTAMQTQKYDGGYLCVYPIKVNQQRHVVEELLRNSNKNIGLEAGSKPELLAVLGLSTPGSTIICNGYKDREYIRLALIGRQLGHRIYIILEKVSELNLVLEEAEKLKIEPLLGVRVRLASIAKGKWQNTGGEKSKFGLSPMQVLQVVDQLRNANQLQTLNLVHFMLGSQVANIRDIQRGMQEGGRFYAELRALGVPLTCIDVGGGLGVDYEGTRSRNFCSINYSMQEYANNIVHIFKEICDDKKLPYPLIITESGRALTAHHAMLVLNVTDIERVMPTQITAVQKNEHPIIQDLWRDYQNIEERALLEIYHDACHWMAEAQALFNHGSIKLADRARAEQIYLTICLLVREKLQPENRSHREVLDELNEKLADKIFANFSLFQSLPDVWAIDQIFPVMPLSDLDKPITRRGMLQDITCDSDGRIDLYVDGQSLQTTLPLPATDTPYYLGVFLVGAYQEILGDMHNLFGDTDSVHVELTAEGGYCLVEPVSGDTVMDTLRYVHFVPQTLMDSYSAQLDRTSLSTTQKHEYLSELQEGLSGYTYLED